MKFSMCEIQQVQGSKDRVINWTGWGTAHCVAVLQKCHSEVECRKRGSPERSKKTDRSLENIASGCM